MAKRKINCHGTRGITVDHVTVYRWCPLPSDLRQRQAAVTWGVSG